MFRNGLLLLLASGFPLWWRWWWWSARICSCTAIFFQLWWRRRVPWCHPCWIWWIRQLKAVPLPNFLCCWWRVVLRSARGGSVRSLERSGWNWHQFFLVTWTRTLTLFLCRQTGRWRAGCHWARWRECSCRWRWGWSCSSQVLQLWTGTVHLLWVRRWRGSGDWRRLHSSPLWFEGIWFCWLHRQWR